MDTSKEYIEMCEKATEIQAICSLGNPPKKGKFIGSNFFNDTRIFRDGIWLPRQDQLQEIITPYWKEKGSYGVPLIQAFYNFAISRAEEEGFTAFNEEILSLKSWEQLWLLFVMKEKYNKTWNGKGWEIVHFGQKT